MNALTKNFSYEYEFELGGSDVTIDVNVLVEAQWVNIGIGAYEFWGAPGYQSQYVWEMVDYKVFRDGREIDIVDKTMVNQLENFIDKKLEIEPAPEGE